MVEKKKVINYGDDEDPIISDKPLVTSQPKTGPSSSFTDHTDKDPDVRVEPVTAVKSESDGNPTFNDVHQWGSVYVDADELPDVD